jgi:hypothetical protein
MSCGNHPAGRTSSDSTATTTAPASKQDSMAASQLKASPVTAQSSSPSTTKPAAARTDSIDDNPEPSLSEIYNDCIDRYDHPVTIDSVFFAGTDVLELHVYYYCLKDSAIKVPKSYVGMYKLDSFVTHNFETQVKLTKNGKVILERTVRKKDFVPFLDHYLKSYAVLLFPDVGMENDTIHISYSITIPLTDVGIGARMLIDRNGKVRFKGQ